MSRSSVPPAVLESHLPAPPSLLGRRSAPPLPLSSSATTDYSSNDSSDEEPTPPSPTTPRSAVPSPQICRRSSPPPLQRQRLTPTPSVSPSALTHDGSKGSFHEGLLRPSRSSPSRGGAGRQLLEDDDVEINKESHQALLHRTEHQYGLHIKHFHYLQRHHKVTIVNSKLVHATLIF